MSFAPVLPSTGFVGYKLLLATEATQREVFEKQPEIRRDVEYFKEKIGDVKTAEELVSDRRLLKVALGAFGMDDEIDKKAFLRRILEEGTENDDAFAKKFVDPRYTKIADAFGFGNIIGARTNFTGFATEITEAYAERQFEIAVGEQNETLRLALNFRREIATYANAKDPESTAWFSAMGDVPVRTVLEGALGLPSATGTLDIDLQHKAFREASSNTFGSKSMDVFKDTEQVENAIRRFIARRSIDEGPSASTPGATALTLLSNAAQGFGSGASQNLLLSSFR